MPSIREYREREFVRQFQEVAFPDENLGRLVGMCYEQEHKTIERDEVKLHETYLSLPEVIARICELSGLSPELLVKIVTHTALKSSQDVPVSQLLCLINDFFVMKKVIEDEANEKG